MVTGEAGALHSNDGGQACEDVDVTWYKLHKVQHDLTQFAPHLTPVQMLEAGVFGGGYFHRAGTADMEGLGRGDLRALADRDRRPPLYKRNAYKVRAGMSYNDWMDKGWIFTEDPLGWFHWYCRYSEGRRHERDDHQKARWISYGERWGRTARGLLTTTGHVSGTVRQGLLQWGYDPARVLHDD